MTIFNGASGDDHYSALSTSETINGLEGNDTLIGGAGNDILNGAPETTPWRAVAGLTNSTAATAATS